MSTLIQENQQAVFSDLPNEFKRKEALTKAIRAGYSRSWLDEKLERGLITGALKRIDRGIYRKTLNHT